MPLVGNSFQNLYYSWKADAPLQLLKRQELQVSLIFSSTPVPPFSLSSLMSHVSDEDGG